MIETEKGYVKITGYICHALMMHQVVTIEKLFKVTERFSKSFSKGLTRTEFDEILDLLNNHAAITGIRNGYIYQNTSTLLKQKTSEEIKSLVGR